MMEKLSPNSQAARWNAAAGCAWVDLQELLDGMLRPFEDLLLQAVDAASASRVLDVGCGTGATTLAIARRIAPDGRAVGVDISAPMLAAAEARAAREGSTARFIRANAQDYAFEPASFDMVVSRFGVMFFDDPVRAFANLRQAIAVGGRLRFIAWRSAAENPFMTVAETAAAPLLPNLPPRRPDEPGQFAFADRNRVRQILEQSGWTDVDIQPVDVACVMPERELLTYAGRLGPVGVALQEADEPTRAAVLDTLRTAFQPYVQGGEVRFTAACWLADARSVL